MATPKPSLFKPLKALSFLGREPVTLPMEPRPASENYRGFHVNDWEKCIGCGTCSIICDNHAITMVEIPDLPSDPEKGVKPRRPAIDYGRCCWCALCVDICPTGSIGLSREYVHISPDLDTYFILPDPNGMHGVPYPEGWGKSADADLLDLERQPMAEAEPEARVEGFDEIVAGFDDQTALLEASRCIQCGMCHEACPTHMHAPEYIRALWLGDVEEAVRQIYRTNPMAHVCGRVCTHRCEAACSIGHRGEPIAIRWLKRYALDQVPHERVRQIAAEGRSPDLTGQRVAIVGAGPAGLTAAYDLARQGHQVVIYEANSRPGGMMRYGIPEYRLPYDRLDEDVDVVTSLGVEVRYDTPVGEKVTMDELERDHDAVILATGLWLGRSTRVPGSDHPEVRSAVALLKDITEGGMDRVPEQAVVIGGGNVAMDIARSVARLQRRAGRPVAVTLTCLEGEGAMLADADEIKEALEEGVVMYPGRGPTAMRIEDGTLRGLDTVRCLSIFDDQGRFHPKYDEDDARFMAGDMVIEAIGQAPGVDFLGERVTEALEWRRGRPVVDAAGRTSVPWLWAAGDLVEGPDVVHAVAAGHRVANSIHGALSKVPVTA